MEDILNFTKNISGINLVDYVVNHINQNMILYSILKDSNYTINACTDDSACIVYDITGLSVDDVNMINTLPSQQTVVIYGHTYTVCIHIPDNDNKLLIKII